MHNSHLSDQVLPFLALCYEVGMETIPFLDFAGLGSGHECGEFEGSSLDDGRVEAEVWTP